MRPAQDLEAWARHARSWLAELPLNDTESEVEMASVLLALDQLIGMVDDLGHAAAILSVMTAFSTPTPEALGFMDSLVPAELDPPARRGLEIAVRSIDNARREGTR